MLARLVNELSKRGFKQIIISTQGNSTDFNYKRVVSFSQIIHFKLEPNRVKEVFQEYPNAKVLAWMYKGIYFSHKWKIKYGSSQQIIWNIRHSNFGWKQFYEKLMLRFFGFASHILNPKIIYCSYKSKKVHEKAFFNKNNSEVIVNRLAKNIDLTENTISNQHTPYLLFVGRFNSQKGPQHLRKILMTFHKQQEDNVEFWIAGNGWELSYFPIEIQSKIKLLGNRKDIYSLYQNAKVLLFTSTFGEGYPNVLVEAAAMGLPIIAFDAGDSKRILSNYIYGYLVENKQSFVEKLFWLLENSPTENDRLGEGIKQRKLLDFSKTVIEYENVLAH